MSYHPASQGSGAALQQAVTHASQQLPNTAVGTLPCQRKRIVPVLTASAHRVWLDQNGNPRNEINVTAGWTADQPGIAFNGCLRMHRSTANMALELPPGAEIFGTQNVATAGATSITGSETFAGTGRGLAPGPCRLAAEIVTLTPHPQVDVGPAEIVDIDVANANVVTPMIALEYTVVPLACTHPPGEVLPHTGLVRVECWIAQTDPGIGYTRDLVFWREAAHIEAYLALDGTGPEQFAPSHGDFIRIPNADVTGGQRKVLFLKGVQEGPLRVSVVLDQQPLLQHIEEVAPPVPIHVLPLRMTLHRDRTLAPNPLSAHDKITPGRIVAPQSAQAHNSRALLTVHKPDDAFWNTGAAHYRVLVGLNAASGSAVLHACDPQGAVGPALPQPHTLTRAEFAQGDVHFWVEGGAASGAVRSIALDLGMTRDPGGLPHAPLRHADLARLTVVRITQVTPATPHYQQLINLPTDPAQPTHGRDFVASATIQLPVAGIRIGFHLSVLNSKAGLPAAQRSCDLAIPVWGVTDAHGVAQASLKLSRYGGDQFQVGAYLEEDAGAGFQQPVFSQPITVWREIPYQAAVMARQAGGFFDALFQRQAFETEMARLFVRMRALSPAAVMLPHDRNIQFINFLPWAQNALALPATLPRPAAIMLIDSLLADQQTDRFQTQVPGGGVWTSSPTPGDWYDVSAQANWLGPAPSLIRQALGPWQSNLPIKGVNHPNNTHEMGFDLTGLPPGGYDVEIDYTITDTSTGRSFPHNIRSPNVQPSLQVTAILPGHASSITGRWRRAIGPWQALPPQRLHIAMHGPHFVLQVDLQGYQGEQEIDVTTTKRPWMGLLGKQHTQYIGIAAGAAEQKYPARAADFCLQVMLHEIGHYLGAGSQLRFDGQNNTHYYDHPGIGPHCDFGNNTSARGGGSCIMCHDVQPTSQPNLHFCAVCEEIIRARDLSNPTTTTSQLAFPN